MKTIMVTRLFSIVILSSALLSCSMTMEGNSPSYRMSGYDERSANISLAANRGLNVDMMDYRVGALMAEAQKLEHDMDMLLARMNALHMDIKKQKKMMDADMAMEAVAVDTPQVLVAIEEGRDKVAEDMPEASMTEPVHSPKTETIQPKPQPKKAKANAAFMKDGVVNIRHGVHKGKTRLVLDINGSTSHTVDFDKEVSLVTIALPKTVWSTAASKTYKLQQLSGFEAKSQGQGGSVVALVVKNTSDVKTSTMTKSGSKPARLVIDLMK